MKRRTNIKGEGKRPLANLIPLAPGEQDKIGGEGTSVPILKRVSRGTSEGSCLWTTRLWLESPESMGGDLCTWRCTGKLWYIMPSV